MRNQVLRVVVLIPVAWCLASCKPRQPETVTVEGVVFLTDQERNNIKFGSAKIYILKAEDVALNVEDAQTWVTQEMAKRTQYAKMAWDNFQDKKKTAQDVARQTTAETAEGGANHADRLFSAIRDANSAKREFEISSQQVSRINQEFTEHLFSRLPGPVAGAISDSEGRFRLEIPKVGKFAIACIETKKVEWETSSEIFGRYKTVGYFWYFYLPAPNSEGVINVQLGMETLFGEGNHLDVVKMPLIESQIPEAEL